LTFNINNTALQLAVFISRKEKFAMNFAKLSALIIGVGLVSVPVSEICAAEVESIAELKTSPETKAFDEAFNKYSIEKNGEKTRWTEREMWTHMKTELWMFCTKKKDSDKISAIAFVSRSYNESMKMSRKSAAFSELKSDVEELIKLIVGSNGSQISENELKLLAENIVNNIGLDEPDPEYVRIVGTESIISLDGQLP
jgi:hypothetical protein